MDLGGRRTCSFNFFLFFFLLHCKMKAVPASVFSLYPHSAYPLSSTKTNPYLRGFFSLYYYSLWAHWCFLRIRCRVTGSSTTSTKISPISPGIYLLSVKWDLLLGLCHLSTLTDPATPAPLMSVLLERENVCPDSWRGSGCVFFLQAWKGV